MSDWQDPITTWTTNRPIQTTDLIRMEGNSSHLRDGTTQFSGNKTFNGTVDVIGEFISRSQMVVREVILIQAAAEIQGNLQIGPRLGLAGTGNLTVSGQVTIGTDPPPSDPILNVFGNADVTGDVDIVGDFSATGTGDIGGNVVIGGALRINSWEDRQQVVLTMSNVGDTVVVPQGRYWATRNNVSGPNLELQFRDTFNNWLPISDASELGYVESNGADLRIERTGGAGTLSAFLYRISHTV